MTSHPNIWRSLPFVALALMHVGDLTPISDSLDENLSGLAIAILWVFFGIYFWQKRRSRQDQPSSGEAISPSDQT